MTDITAIVTGGCSGLGFATAMKLKESGAKVALFDVDTQKGNDCVAKLGKNSARFYAVNVCDEQAVSDAISDIAANGDTLRICVNCAGISPAARIVNRQGEAASLDQFRQVMDVNLVGTFNVARLAAKAMAHLPPLADSQERGIIINTASIAGYEGQIGQTAYAASKGAIISMTLPMARDLASVGIRVNTIAPGVMGTPLLLGMPENVQEALAANVPFPQRLGLPDEFASLVAHIIDNTYLNGETLRLDGALRMPPK